MNPTLDPVFTTALRRELVALPTPKPRRTRRRVAVITSAALGAVALGGVSAVAGYRPAGEVATPPLAPPVIVNGVGATKVMLPAAPSAAAYVHIELTCFNGTRCMTPGGGTSGGTQFTTPYVERDALPLTDKIDPHNQQRLDPIDPTVGVPIEVDADTHWRLYAVYSEGLNPTPAPVGNGATLGVPGNMSMPDLVPAVATNGQTGWINYHQLTDQAHPQLTDDGTEQAPIPVYDADGTTIIGHANVSQPYPTSH